MKLVLISLLLLSGCATFSSRPPAPVKTPAARSTLVTNVQQKLLELDFYSGQVDGIPGPVTRDAVLRFKKSYKIHPANSEINNELLGELNRIQKDKSLYPEVNVDDLLE